MSAGALYGAFIAGVLFILTKALPGTTGSIVFWTGLAIQLSVGSVIVWRRTRLPMMTASVAWGAGISVILTLSAMRGMPFEQLFWRDPVVVSTSLLLAPAVMFSERWLHPQAWHRLAQAIENSSVLDIMAFRHIPVLTDSESA